MDAIVFNAQKPLKAYYLQHPEAAMVTDDDAAERAERYRAERGAEMAAQAMRRIPCADYAGAVDAAAEAICEFGDAHHTLSEIMRHCAVLREPVACFTDAERLGALLYRIERELRDACVASLGDSDGR